MIKWRKNYCCEIWPEWHYIFYGNCRISKETYLVLSHDNIKRYRLYIYRDMLFNIEMMLPVMILHWYLFYLTLSYFFFIKWFRIWRYTKLTNEPFKLLNNKKSCYKNLLQVLYFLISDCKRYMFLFPNNFSPSKKIFRVCALKKLCKNNIVIFFPTKYRQRKKTLQSINLLSYYCAISL